jgi:hypothetical protein
MLNPSYYERPVFTINPLNYLINNPFSGTMNINNLNQINRLYEMVKESVHDNGFHGTSMNISTPAVIQSKPSIIFATSNTHKELFETKLASKPQFINKDKKIFNITKEPKQMSKFKPVKILYNHDYYENENANYNYEYENEMKEISNTGEAVKDEFYEHKEEDEHYVENHEELVDENSSDIMFENNPRFLNMNIFK